MLKAAPIFKDHMVLQREKPLHIWGTADGTGKVTIRLGRVERIAEVKKGRWEALLPPLAAGGPYTLTLTQSGETITLTDVMVGEVWLCGGQSNMELGMNGSDDPEPAYANCEQSNVRLYHVGKRGFFDEQFYREEADSHWQLPCKNTVQYWTAVGYHFAAELAKKLGVTVGLVECNYGGTSASAWVSEEMLASDAVGQSYLKDYADGMAGMTDEAANKAYRDYCEYHNKWNDRVAACYAENPSISWAEVLEKCGENRYPGPCAPINPLRPHGLYDTMLSRITPYTLRGVLYYQGESDDHRPEGYETLLKLLITQWRRDFRDDALPFLLVQLPMFCYEETQDGTNWAQIREAQEKVYRTVKNTGLAVILDCGQFNEIHPKEKRTPAHRLYLQALDVVYHLQTQGTTAPLLRFAVPENGGILCYFDNVDNGLELRGETGFEVCGADGIWHPARAVANEETLFLKSMEVPYPVAARYAWVNYAEVTAFEQNGLPVAPFRT